MMGTKAQYLELKVSTAIELDDKLKKGSKV